MGQLHLRNATIVLGQIFPAMSEEITKEIIDQYEATSDERWRISCLTMLGICDTRTLEHHRRPTRAFTNRKRVDGIGSHLQLLNCPEGIHGFLNPMVRWQ